MRERGRHTSRGAATSLVVASFLCALTISSAAEENEDVESFWDLVGKDGPWEDEEPWQDDDGPRDDEEDTEEDTLPTGTREAAAPHRGKGPADPPRAQARIIEEIIVTAQKREQAIEDVPVSMSVIDDQFIVEQGITDIREALLFVPNVQLETGTTIGGPRCRGFSLNTRNRAFEPPCGVAIDGVPYTAPEYFNLALFDVERVEVLRGPQGTNFGKNSTAGVIHLVTKNPADEFSGHFGVQTGELDRRRFEGAIGGPLVAGVLNFRFAGLSEVRDGYLRNTTAEVVPVAVRRPLAADREGFRAKLGFPDLLGSDLTVSYENVRLTVDGFGTEGIDVSDDIASFMREFDPNADFERGNFVASIHGPEKSRVDIDTLQADWGYELSEWTIAAVGAHSDLNLKSAADVDFFPVPMILADSVVRQPTTTFELRTFSPNLAGLYGLTSLFGRNLGSSDVLVGFFYQRRDIDDWNLQLTVDDPLLLTVLALDGSGGTGLVPVVPPVAPESSPAKETTNTLFNQNARTIAGFAELQWHFLEPWTLQYGMRISHEAKEATWDQALSDPHPVLTVAGWGPFTAARSGSELQFLPKVSLNYRPTDEISLFARWARGFKGGGFNAFSMNGEASEQSSLEFDPEIATEWAIDAKMSLFDRSAQLNVTLFRMNVTDFQWLVQVNDEITGFPGGNTVINVGKARSQGIEADLTYLATDWLTVLSSLGFNDTEFVDFPFNQCPQGEAETFCDASGRPFPHVPKWNGTLTLNLTYPLPDLLGTRLEGLELRSGATVELIGSQLLNVDLDRRSRQPAFARLKASLGFGNPTQRWSFNVIGENLTNEVTSLREDRILGVTANFLEPPRTFYGQFQIEF